MDDNFSNINIVHKDYIGDFENKFIDQIDEKIDLGEHMIVFFKKLDKVNEDSSTHNVSIAIAAAITAYSRIHMSIFKNNPKINLYYTDTDSIYTDSEIDVIINSYFKSISHTHNRLAPYLFKINEIKISKLF
jgi:hypothetical protein